MIFTLLPLLATQVLGSNILSVLRTFNELSTLNFHLNASSNLSSFLTSSNNFTFLAPSNAAFDTFFGGLSPSTPTEAEIEAVLTYHFLFGGWPGASFTQTSQFVTTNLGSGKLANVTGGQVIKLLADSNGNPQFISGNNAVATVAKQDILFFGGLIHIINEVLTVPPNIVSIVTEAKLNFSVALIDKAGLLSSNSSALVRSIFSAPDLTVFMPNSKKAINSFTAISAQHPSADDLVTLFNYHQVTKFVGYSHLLEDGMELKTVEGQSLRVTKEGNETFIDGAKIITSDLLVANGVLHVIDDTLNPFDPTTPSAVNSSTSTTASTSTSKPSSTAVKSEEVSSSQAALGVGITLAFLVPVCIAIFTFWYLSRKRKAMNARAKSSMKGKEIQVVRKFKIGRPFTAKQDPELEESSPVTERGDTNHFPPPITYFNRPYRVTSTLSAQEMDGGTSMPKLKYRDAV